MSQNATIPVPPLITNVETTTATVTDNEVIDDIHKRLAARELLPTHHSVDAGYMDAKQIIVAMATHGVDIVGPMHQDTKWQARHNRGYAAADFDVDWAKQTVRCPQGSRAATGGHTTTILGTMLLMGDGVGKRARYARYEVIVHSSSRVREPANFEQRRP